MTVRRYDGQAFYLVKERYSFGARYRDLSVEESKAVKSVNGVVLAVIVRGSAAAAAGFLPGDIVLSADGKFVIDSRQLLDYLSGKAGQTVTFGMVRDGEKREISVTLGFY